MRKLLIISFIVTGIFGGIERVQEKEDFRYFLTDADILAMEWIKKNTRDDAVFGINTVMWVAEIPHGRDGGYWIPYFAKRQTNAATMHIGLGPDYFKERKVLQSKAVIEFQRDPSQASVLSTLDIDYFYTGPTSQLFSNGLEPNELFGNPKLRLVYNSYGVAIFETTPSIK